MWRLRCAFSRRAVIFRCAQPEIQAGIVMVINVARVHGAPWAQIVS
jgi:hypothetical protein